MPDVSSFAENDFDSYYQVQYAPRFRVGHGVHLLNGKTAYGTPFPEDSLKLNPLSKVATRATFRFSMLRTEADVQKAMEHALDVSAPIEGVPVSASAGYLSDIKTSKTEMSSILETSFEPDAQFLEKTPIFTDKARELLDRSPEEFERAYGSYYVAGYISKSWIKAIASHVADKEEEMVEFRAGITASLSDIGVTSDKKVQDVVEPDPQEETEPQDEEEGQEEDQEEKDAAAAKKKVAKTSSSKIGGSLASKISSKTASSRVTTSVEFDAGGIKGHQLAAFSLEEVAKVFARFGRMCAPTPQVALLRSYKEIDSRCLAPGQSLFQNSPSELKKALKALYKVQDDLLAHSYPELQANKDELYKLYSRVVEFTQAKADFNHQLTEWHNNLEAQKTEIHRKVRRRVFFAQIKSNFENGRMGCQGEQHDCDDGTYDFPRGIFRWSHFDNQNTFIRDHEIEVDELDWSVDWKASNQTGLWRLEELSYDCVKVKFESDTFRGSHWMLRVHSVPKHLYHRD
ncbi:hypothetical protein JCM10213_001374 [Rhodosporidiobolus nylandii]